MKRHRHGWPLLFGLLALCWCGAAMAQTPPAAGGGLAADATEYRANAVKLRERAGQWRALALHERADGARNQADLVKTGLSTTAHVMAAGEAMARVAEAQAQRLDQGAASFDALADAADASVKQQSNEPSITDDPKTPPAKRFLGVWRNPDDNSEITIEAQSPGDPAHAPRLLLKTKKHTYTGEYVPGSDPKPARLVFSHLPTAPELNKEIPEAARIAVAGQMHGHLEWQIQIDPTDGCGCGEIEARWYPGEITWPEADPGQAKVTGKGKPVTLKYRRPPLGDPALVSKPVVFVRSADLRQSRFLPFQAVSQGQPFYIEVLMPRSDTSPADSVTVTLKATKSGTERQLVLTGEQEVSGVWHYRTAVPQVLINQGWANWIVRRSGEEFVRMILERAMLPPSVIRGPPPGAMSFPTENGEEIEVTFEKSRASFRIYDDPIEVAVAGLLRQVNDAAISYQALLLEGGVPAAVKRELDGRVRMVTNLHALLAYFAAEGTGAVPQQTRLVLASLYGSLLGEVQSEDFASAPDTVDQYGVRYASNFERRRVHDAIIQVQENKLELALGAAKDALDESVNYSDVITAVTGFSPEKVKITFTGVDLNGHKVDTTERVISSVNTALWAFVDVATAFTAARGLSAGTAAIGAQVERVAAEETMAVVGREVAPALLETPLGLGSEMNAASGLGHLLPSAKIVGRRSADMLRRQCHKYSCALQSFLHGADEALGGALQILETETTGWAARMGIFNPLAGTRLKNLREFAARFGARAGVGSLTLLEVQEMIDAGKKVLVGILTTGKSGHAVRVLRVIKDAKGVATEVLFFDSGPGAIVRMDACEFTQQRLPLGETAFVYDFGPK